MSRMTCTLCGAHTVSAGNGGECHTCGSAVSRRTAPSSALGSGPSRISLPDQAERRQITVVFCDLVGSTALSENLGEGFHELLRSYHKLCTRIVQAHRGHVAQYTGDGVLAYFGYPRATETAAVDAVTAALELVRSVPRLSDQMAGLANPPPELDARVGVHTGLVVVGELGDVAAPQTLASGLTVNVASRVEGQAPPGCVCITGATHHLVEDDFDCLPLGARQLHHVAHPISLYLATRRTQPISSVARSGTRGLSTLVGRNEELRTLRKLWDMRRSGIQHGVVIVGEPGIGKSRLVHEFLSSVQSKRVVDLSGAQHREADALFPVLQQLRSWGDQVHSEDSVDSRLDALELGDTREELIALLAAAQGHDNRVPGVQGVQHFHRTLEVLRRFLTAITRGDQAIVLIEDTQWLDPSTIDLLEGLSKHDDQAPFIVATARPGTNLAWTGQNGAKLEPIVLERLSPPAAAEMVERIAMSMQTSLKEEIIECLIERGEGVPLVIEEATRAWADLERTSASLEGGTDWQAPAIPHRLKESLTARLDRLGAARSVAQIAAVLGREFPLRWLTGVAEASTDVVMAAIADLVSAGVIYSVPHSEPTFAFSHALVRDAAYESLTLRARARAHGRLYKLLEEEDPDLAARDPILMARHAAASEEVAAAAGHLLRAARRALVSAASREAQDLTARALELIRRSPDPPSLRSIEVEVLAASGLSHIAISGYSTPEVEEIYSRAAQLCHAQGASVPLHVFYGVWGAALVRADTNRVAALASLLEKRLADLPEEPKSSQGSTDERLIIHACLGVRGAMWNDIRAGRLHFVACTEALDRSDPAGHHQRLLSNYGFETSLSGPMWLAYLDGMEGHVIRAKKGMRETWALAERIRDPYMSAQVSAYFATLCRELRLPDLGERYVSRARTIAERHGYSFWHAIALCNAGWLKLEAGDSDGALDDVRGGLAILDLAGAMINRPFFQTYLVEVHLARGENDRAISAAEAGLEMCRNAVGSHHALMRQKGLALGRHGALEAAENHLRAAASLARIDGQRRTELLAARDLAALQACRGTGSDGMQMFERAAAEWPDTEKAPFVVQAHEALRSMLARGSMA